MHRICPNPKRWNDVFERLLRYADTHACTPSRPPTPLILGGWWATNDTEKICRWEETTKWAVANGCADITRDIPDEDFYYVDEPSNYLIGPLGGPSYRPWDFQRKERPSSTELCKHLGTLVTHWADIAGPELARVTRPIAFTGKKARRLMIDVADESARPPWGASTNSWADPA